MPETMSPKPGDRVRVEFEGVFAEWFPRGSRRMAVTVPGETFRAVVHPQHVTVIAKPVVPGDRADLAVLDTLPDGSIVAAADGSIAYLRVHRGVRHWLLPGDERPFPSVTLASRGTLTVERVGR